MIDDLEVITKEFDKSHPISKANECHLYAIGDVHIASPQFNEQAIKKKIDIIKNDELGVVTLCGDICDYALRNSKSNIYQSTIPNPQDQMQYAYDLFYPIKDRMRVSGGIMKNGLFAKVSIRC